MGLVPYIPERQAWDWSHSSPGTLQRFQNLIFRFLCLCFYASPPLFCEFLYPLSNLSYIITIFVAQSISINKLCRERFKNVRNSVRRMVGHGVQYKVSYIHTYTHTHILAYTHTHTHTHPTAHIHRHTHTHKNKNL